MLKTIIIYTQFVLVCTVIWMVDTHAQTYPDHIGSGNYVGVQVNNSDTSSNNEGLHSLTGEQLFPNPAAASRFLAQATLGHNWEDIQRVQSIGIEDWLTEQIAMPYTTFLSKVQEIYHFSYFENGMDTTIVTVPYQLEQDYMLLDAFYEKLYTEENALRQRVAFALNQIVVVGGIGSSNKATGYAQFYDILYENAFGNYRDILYGVSTHHWMGIYLTFVNNRKTDYSLLSYPDENYAREIMQLYSIGLWELNNDGTPKLDADGKRIPTYDNNDIQELAKVFTGLVPGDRLDESANYRRYEWARPLIPNELWHEKTAKTMIDGTVLPPGRTTEEDLSDAIDILFNHPNTGPFVAQRMIQHMVKSNPSPAYVNRVATAFNNNGKGVRGDMAAVTKAILLDPEARNCDLMNAPDVGKLIQPIERFTKLFLAFDISTPSNRFYINGRFRTHNYSFLVGQEFFQSQTVFNFFLPDYAESSLVAPAGLLSPEFQILSTTSAIHYINLLENVLKVRPFDNQTLLWAPSHGQLSINSADQPTLDFSDEINIYNSQGISALLDRLDILLCRGSLTTSVRNTITNTINQYETGVAGYSAEDAVKDVIYFIMISDFPILK